MRCSRNKENDCNKNKLLHRTAEDAHGVPLWLYSKSALTLLLLALAVMQLPSKLDLQNIFYSMQHIKLPLVR